MTGHLGMLTGDRVYRVHWIPGSDTLIGVCHCGADRTAEDPIELWDWLLAHPDGHTARRLEPAPPPRPVHAGVAP